MYDIIGSIVVFKNGRSSLIKTIQSFLNVDLKTYLYVVDNSPTDALRDLCNYKNVEYIYADANLGFGSAHNLVIDGVLGKSKYHLILNPDVSFSKSTVEEIFKFMEKNTDIGCLMPKALYLSGEPQYLCHLLPTPLNLFWRRFIPESLKGLYSELNFKYEMRFSGYDKIMDIPCLSGAFMFIKSQALEKAGTFDQKFFMYMEDVDLSRRMVKYFRNVYFPDVFIYHEHAKGSYKKLILLKYHLISAISYFNKWGWFFDNERKLINNKAMVKFAKK